MIKVDDADVTFTGSFADGTQITSNDTRFGDTITIQPFYGSDTQSASSLLTTLDSWGSNHKLSGLCYLAFRIKWDSDKYSNIPKIQAEVEGKKIEKFGFSSVFARLQFFLQWRRARRITKAITQKRSITPNREFHSH